MSKLRVGVMLLSPLYVRSWIQTGILAELKQVCDVTILLPKEESSLIQSFEDLDVRTFSLQRTKSQDALWFLEWIGSLDSSTSFRVRFLRAILGDRLWWPKKGSFWLKCLSWMRGVLRLVTFLIHKPHYLLAWLGPLRNLLTRLILKGDDSRVSRVQHLSKDLEGLDYLVIPNLAYETALSEILNASRLAGTRTVLCLDNWDNLTSKIVFSVLPDYITVMGRSSVEIARSLHGFKIDQVWPIGLPRFEPYRRSTRSINAAGRDRPESVNLLYVGYSVPFDEVSAIRDIQAELSVIEGGPKLVRVRYRPHPAGPNLPKPDQALDFEVTLGDERQRLSNGGLPPLDLAYFEDLKWADIVIGPPTTFMVEALLSRLPVIVDLSHDGVHRTSPGNLWFKYAHMRQLVDLPGLNIGRTSNSVAHHLMNLVNNDFTMQIDQEELSNLIALEETSFSLALVNAMENAIEGRPTTKT